MRPLPATCTRGSIIRYPREIHLAADPLVDPLDRNAALGGFLLAPQIGPIDTSIAVIDRQLTPGVYGSVPDTR